MSIEETEIYLLKRGITPDELLIRFYKYSKGHPFLLRMMCDLYLNKKDIDFSISKTCKDTISNFIRNIKDTLPIKLQKESHYLPFCRFFEHRLVSWLFNINDFQVSYILQELQNMFYIQQVGDTGLFHFHDLFSNSQRMNITKDEIGNYDKNVIEFYK